MAKPGESNREVRPLVFLLTDGSPTDAWEGEAETLKREGAANIIACATGPGADPRELRRVTETVLELDEMSARC